MIIIKFNFEELVVYLSILLQLRHITEDILFFVLGDIHLTASVTLYNKYLYTQNIRRVYKVLAALTLMQAEWVGFNCVCSFSLLIHLSNMIWPIKTQTSSDVWFCERYWVLKHRSQLSWWLSRTSSRLQPSAAPHVWVMGDDAIIPLKLWCFQQQQQRATVWPWTGWCTLHHRPLGVTSTSTTHLQLDYNKEPWAWFLVWAVGCLKLLFACFYDQIFVVDRILWHTILILWHLLV